MRDTLMVQRLIEMVSIIKSLLNGIWVNVYCVIYVNQVGSEVKSQQRGSNGFDSTFLLCPVHCCLKGPCTVALQIVSALDTISGP